MPDQALFKTLIAEMSDLAIPEDAANVTRFFKTGAGEYGAGDQFLGIRVPVLRQLAKRYIALPIEDVWQMLRSPVHEQRMLALFIAILHFDKGTEKERKAIYNYYMRHIVYVNNWDLVDCSAAPIAGRYLLDKSRQPLIKFAKSPMLWERRVSVIATFHFIKHNDYDDTLRIAQILLNDNEDLIHKAVGWMLREIGNRNPVIEEAFLQTHYQKMPRTMLRYAIEKFPKARRQAYLKGKI